MTDTTQRSEAPASPAALDVTAPAEGTLADLAPTSQRQVPPGWLEASMLQEGPPGRFRQAVVACAPAPQPEDLFAALVSAGFLRTQEASIAAWPLQAAMEAADPGLRAAWLATALQEVGLPLAGRGVFADDPALRSACDWLATA